MLEQSVSITLIAYELGVTRYIVVVGWNMHEDTLAPFHRKFLISGHLINYYIGVYDSISHNFSSLITLS